MKKLFLILSAAILALTACNSTKTVEFGDVRIPYDSSKYSVLDLEEDNDALTFLLLSKKEDAYMYVEIVNEAEDQIAEADPNILQAYLVATVQDFANIWFTSDEDKQLSSPFDPSDLKFSEDNPLSTVAYLDGTSFGEKFYGAVTSSMLGHYKVTGTIQAQSKDQLNAYFSDVLSKITY